MAGPMQGDPLAAVRAFVEAFNDHDVERLQAACTDETSIIDDFPPYGWTGDRSATTWYLDMAGMASKYGMSEWSVTCEAARYVTASDRQAYVVVPVVVRWMQDGAAEQRTGTLTAALREPADEWRVSAYAWAWD